MTDAPTEALLNLEHLLLPRPERAGRCLFVSLNPDLVTDFGHFLNYEKRLREACQQVGMDYRCFANRGVSVEAPGIVPVFEHDAGHYSLMRSVSAGKEAVIAQSFGDTVRAAIAQVDPDRHYERIYVFSYCGSSRLAVRLADQAWDPRVLLCVNAFWDFLLKERDHRHLAPLAFQRQVRMLAMSDLHQAEIRDRSGLHFDFIPNPPPLLDDRQAHDALRAQAAGLYRRHALQVLVPGLMSLGKGKESTGSLVRHVREHGDPGWRFVFRDRHAQLGEAAPPRLSLIHGDLTDEAVADLYRRSDVVVLPYEPETFGVRTSGALVDSLMFGAVPLVHRGTWLAHVCETLQVGRVLPDMQPDTLMQAIADIATDLPAERARVLVAGGRYLAAHHWGRLLDVVAAEPAAGLPTRSPTSPPTERSALAAANRLFRERRFADAARIYAFLRRVAELPVYDRGLELCDRGESERARS